VDRWAFVVVCSTSWTRGETVKLNDKLLRSSIPIFKQEFFGQSQTGLRWMSLPLKIGSAINESLI
jgi:hypothetical protein